MGRTRRKVSVTDQEDNASICTSPAFKGKENRSPTSLDEDEEKRKKLIIALRKDFDQNVQMTINEMIARTEVLIDKITLPCRSALMKMPVKIKKLKWSEYLKLRENPSPETLTTIPNKVERQAIEANDFHNFAVPTGSSKMETPALRSSSRLAKNKFPIITPKFDPATGTIINKRLPIPGETLYSEKGSPVGTNAPKLSVRELSSLNAVGDKELVAAFLNNPETLNTFKAFEKKYKGHKMRKD